MIAEIIGAALVIILLLTHSERSLGITTPVATLAIQTAACAQRGEDGAGRGAGGPGR